MVEFFELQWLRASIQLAEVREQIGNGYRGSVSAQSTVEYALVGALVVIAAAGALTILGGQVNTVFGNISSTLKTAATSSSGH
jgi:Flp pilus assembly pilin Flp